MNDCYFSFDVFPIGEDTGQSYICAVTYEESLDICKEIVNFIEEKVKELQKVADDEDEVSFGCIFDVFFYKKLIDVLTRMVKDSYGEHCEFDYRILYNWQIIQMRDKASKRNIK